MKAPQPVPLKIEGLSVSAGSRPILEDISLTVEARQIVSIAGPSGSGKSTLLRAVNRLADQESGLTVSGNIHYRGADIFDGYPVHWLRKQIGMVFQKPCVYPGSVMRNVLFGARHHRVLSIRDEKQVTEEVLRKAHLWEEVKKRLHSPASELSLGQKQRLCFARVLACEPDLLLLDEPTSSLDPHSTLEIEKTLLELKDTKSILLVTHLPAQARRLSDRILFISASGGAGKLVDENEAAALFGRFQDLETQESF